LRVGAGESWNIADIKPSLRASLHHCRVRVHARILRRLLQNVKADTDFRGLFFAQILNW
jgi:hypothetical protein